MKRLLARALLLGVALTGLVATKANATPVEFNTHYYDIFLAPAVDWPTARAHATTQFYNGLQGHLVTITSAEEDAAVHAMIVANGGGEMWAGAYQDPANETNAQAGWTWVNGEGTFPGTPSASPYANWGPGEPNDYYGSGSEQYLGLNFNNGWNDEAELGFITGYVIEYDPNTIDDRLIATPEPGSLLLLGTGLAGAVIARRRRARKA